MLLALALANIVPAAPPAPPPSPAIAASRVSEPVIVTPTPPRPWPTVTYDVEVRFAGAPYWSGTMRVADMTGASFNQQKTDASDLDCPGSRRGSVAQERSSFSIRISPGYGERRTLQLVASLERPAAAATCDTGGSLRTVGLTQSVPVDGDRDLKFEGDAGLVIRLHRR